MRLKKQPKAGAWEDDLTLCIAALCHSAQRVVISFDRRVETEIASAETEFKYERLSDTWSAMFAGSISLARELATLYKELFEALAEDPQPKGTDLLRSLYSPLNALRKSEADRHVQSRLAISYDELLRNGQKWLSDDIYRQTLYDVAAQELRVQLILMGWIGERFALFKVSGGRVFRCEPFSVIGSGSDIAEPAMYQREHDETQSVSTSIYRVYEAQRLGQIAPGVGKQFYVAVLNHDNGEVYPSAVSTKAIEFLDEQFAIYGPKRLPEGLTLPEKSVIPIRRRVQHLPADDEEIA